jgi:4-hydroxy-tetrahydrodipicolinate synthase
MFHGSLVALVTPMTQNQEIDYQRLSELIEWQIANFTDGIVILGTTGESPTVQFDERERIIRNTVDQVAGRVPVIVGTGTNSTQTTIKLTSHAMEHGADACLVVTPYYNKPTQEGLYKLKRVLPRRLTFIAVTMKLRLISY